MRVGLIADTHMPGSIGSLWPQVHEAFRSVDCILHAGDLHVGEVIDELETLAPTFVCAGNGDYGVSHPKLKEVWLGSLAGVQVGLVHKFPTPRRADASRLQRQLDRVFAAGDPKVVIYGHTHRAEMHRVEGRLYVNPGSPTLPNNQSTRHGTIGLLEISESAVSVELHQIHDDGLSLIERHD
ncbi:MAG: YfcE family phosphodiesterase [Gammaproteobacteria bacterium]|nr:YfcE family phosphodiesterase [Gammaproteobacteria bacterium]